MQCAVPLYCLFDSQFPLQPATPCVVAAAVAGLESLLLEMEQIQGQGKMQGQEQGQGKEQGLEEEVDRLTDSLVTAMGKGEEWEEKKEEKICVACNTVLEETVLQVLMLYCTTVV